VDLELAGRVALVTGASRGLGAAIAAGLAREGALVVGAARTTGDLVTLELDVEDETRLSAAVDEVVARHGRIDILVNNAGIAPAGAFVDQDPEVWRRVFGVNVFAPMHLSQAAARKFRDQGDGGKIVNVASTAGVRGKPEVSAYSSSKAALIRLTEALAAEWAAYDIQVNAIAPGAFVTEAQRAVLESETVLARRVRRIPAQRMADPEEIAALACYLSSRLSRFVTGSTYVIDGGESGKL
jgi:2-deoxy-D-gluconate 3-dehydrogenase